MEEKLIISIMWKLLCIVFHNVEIKRWIKSYNSFTHGLKMNLVFNWSNMHWDDKNAQFVMPKVLKITHNLFCKNVENQAIYTRGRFMKYFMTVFHHLWLVNTIFGIYCSSLEFVKSMIFNIYYISFLVLYFLKLPCLCS